MAHPHNPDWPDGYEPTAVEVHTNFARLIADAINADIISGGDPVRTLDVLDECAILGCILMPDFAGVASVAYYEAL